jgi:hypothetical protein
MPPNSPLLDFLFPQQGPTGPAPMSNLPSGGKDLVARLSSMPEGQRQILAILQSHGFDTNSAEATNKMIAAMRGADNHSMANAAENLFNYLNQGRPVPVSLFDLPTYQKSDGYR